MNKKYPNHLRSEQEIEDIFHLNSNQVMLAGDKNIGYVCLDKEDLLDQYLKINNKQHFGETNIKKPWYINNILCFLKDAAKNIPSYELSDIVKKKLTLHGMKKEPKSVHLG